MKKLYSLFCRRQSRSVDLTKWKFAKERLVPEVWPECTPSFKINKKNEIFTISSCFIRDIEEHLANLGYKIPMMNFSVPKTERKAPRAGIFNKFSPPAIFRN